MISDSSIEEVKRLIDIVDVISDFVELKKAGSSYKALSPFTDEKTPSFFVSPSKGLFKCFSTGKGGDAISFVQEFESMTYLEAIRYLAKKYHVELEEHISEEAIAERSEKESLYIILNFAKEWFADTLWNHEDGKAIGLSYFRERGLSDSTIKDFDLGYTLDLWDGFLNEATSKGYLPELMEKAGMIITKEGGKQYDRFRARVMFPIHNVSGRVLGFGARMLGSDKKQPKYINSPESEVYNKSSVLYGLFQGKHEIRNKDRCYLVEGYMDVVTLYQAGIKNVVASSGTSLTEEQIKLISRYTKHITVLYDGDAAGLKAATRGIDMIIEHGLQVKIVLFPDGHDPDSYVREVGASAFEDYISTNSKDFVQFKADLLGKSSDTQSKAEAIADILETISKIPETIMRSVYIKEVSDKFGIDEQIIYSEVNKRIIERGRKEKKRDPQAEIPPPELMMPEVEEEVMDSNLAIILQERQCVKLLLNYGFEQDEQYGLYHQWFFESTEDVEWMDPVSLKILSLFHEAIKKDFNPDTNYFLKADDEEVKNFVAECYFEKYELSENWELKYQIVVLHESKILDTVFPRNILLLKYRHIRLKMNEELTKLKEAVDPAKQDEIMFYYSQYKMAQMEYAKELGIIVDN